jgi:hypothetical protein
LGPIISRLFTCSNAEKNKFKKTKGACSSPISMAPADWHSSVPFGHLSLGRLAPQHLA